MPCRAHAPAGIGPEAARDGTGVRWRCQLDLDGGRRCDPSPFKSAPDGPGYRAVVLAAYSAAGNSIFAIAEPGGWWRAAEGPGDVVC
jgi:hypothetical protein